MIKKLVLLPATLLLLSSCGQNEDTSEIKFISPTGAPALAFYDQGANENYSTFSTPSLVAAELQKSDYDCIIFDSVTGLASIKKNNADYKLLKIITAGNFYLVSIDKDADANGNYELPDEDDVVVSFGQGNIPDLVYNRLCDDYWKIKTNVEYVGDGGVKDAGAVLSTGKFNNKEVDYVFIAEPVLTSVMNNKEADTYGKVHIVKDIRAEWKNYSGQDGLAQAGLFVSKNALEHKKSKLTDFVVHMNSSIQIAIDDPNSAADTMNAYGSLTEQASRFGFNANTVKAVQGNNKNGFGLLSPSKQVDVNAFLEKLGQPTYSDDYFASL